MNIADLLIKGGPIVWVLFSLSVFALAIVLERWVHFLRMGRPPQNLDIQLPDALRNASIDTLVAPLRGPEAAIIKAIAQASKDGVTDLARTAVRIGSLELQRMERRLRLLGMIANTAPLIGLLGTITGMIKAFMVIEQAGGKVDAQALAGGIWEAMITTGIGLAVAIPVLFLLHALEGMAERRAHAMQRCASLMIDGLPHCSEVISSEQVSPRQEASSGV